MQLNYYKKQNYTNRNNIIKSRERLVWHWAKKIPSFLMVALISIYQLTLSPDHGIISLFTYGQCRFRPTCSEHTKRAIQQRGVVMGLRKGWNQFKKCH